MAKQRYVYDSFWTDPYIETLQVDEKLLFIYYLTNPLCNIAVIYEIRDSRISYELSIAEKRIKLIKEKFVKDEKILIFKDWIVLKNFAKHQSPNPNVLLGMQRIINTLPSDLKALKGFESLSHFTLLNLTYNRANSDTKMDIDYETGLLIPEKGKSHKREDVIKLSLMFDKMASDYAKIKIITPRSYFIVLNAINTHGLKPKGIIKLFIDWFENEKTKPEDKIKMSWALGKDNINSFKMLNK